MKTLLNLVSLKAVAFFILGYVGLGYLKFDVINNSAMKIPATFPWALMLLCITVVFVFYIRFLILEAKEQQVEKVSTELI